jgi:bifunctional non-homologous end joining protein LigD
MLATTGVLPQGPGWCYEFKWDGMRALVDIAPADRPAGPDGVQMVSRNGNDISRAYPEVRALLGGRDAPDVLLDGELVAFDSAGRPSFALLQRRMHVRSGTAAAQLALQVPVTYVIFDLLRLHGVDLRDRPLSERRATLERLGADRPDWVISPTFDDGEATAAAARQNGLEGVVAKRLSSLYRAGQRTSDWVKVKFLLRQEFVVVGWRSGEGRRADSIGSLMLAVADAGEASGWRYMGQVGSGLSDRTLGELMGALAATAPSAPVVDERPERSGALIETWVAPVIIVEVEYSGLGGDGKLRHPVFVGVRNDKDPADVVWEGVA